MKYEDLTTGMEVADGNCVRRILYVHDKGVLTEITKDNRKEEDIRFKWAGVVTFFPKRDLDHNIIRYWREHNEQTSFFVFLNKKKHQAWEAGSCHYFTTKEAAEHERRYFKELGDDVTTITETFTDESRTT